MGLITKEYYAEPTGALFHNALEDVRFVEGPVGSGKSTMSIIELLRMGMDQQPDDEGVRYSRWAIIRATNPQLRATTIKTFELWIPSSIAPVVYTAPIGARMKQTLDDGTKLDIEFVFLALDQADDVEKLTSLDLTGAYINETREIEKTHFDTLQGRIGRFPQTRKDSEGNTIYGPTHIKIIMDSNAPKTSHWLYDTFYTGKTPDGFKKFTQPPAVYWDAEQEKWLLNPDAENLSHLDDNYYARQLRGASDEYIRVMLAGEPGMSQQGKPVFPTYSERKHVAPEKLNPIRGLNLIIGFDFGLYPAAIFGQLTNKGYRVLDELPMEDASLDEFIVEGVLPLMKQRYPGYPIIATGDPAGSGRSDIDKRSRYDVLASYGLRAFPAMTNSFITRKETVDWFLKRDEGLIISPHCTVLREAFGGGYVYKEMRGKSGRYMERPDKNIYSHPMDGLQYALLYAKYGTTHQRTITAEQSKPFHYV